MGATDKGNTDMNFKKGARHGVTRYQSEKLMGGNFAPIEDGKARSNGEIVTRVNKGSLEPKVAEKGGIEFRGRSWREVIGRMGIRR